MARALALRWTSHLKGAEVKKAFEASLRSSTALHRLFQILSENAETLNNTSFSAGDFEDPNWAYKQAFRNGQMAQIKQLQDLLSFIDPR